jgi:hypothetical protein
MAFIPGIVPLTDTRSNPMMSPQTDPFSEGGKVERGVKAIVRTQTNSKSNTNDREQDKRTDRKPNYDRRQFTNSRGPAKIRYDRPDQRGKGKYTLNSSDFGFEIQGSSSPTIYSGSKDQTLFRDYNQGGHLPETWPSNSVNSVTNSIKLLDIDFSQSISPSRGYSEAWNVIADLMYTDVIINTKSAKGALDRMSNAMLLNYFSVVSRGFDMLIQLEVLQAWNPSDNEYFDASLRQLSAKACTPELLRARTTLRQALIPHILPDKMLDYIRWIRETKLRNTSPESTKERFVDRQYLNLYYHLTVGQPPTLYFSQIAAMVTEITNLDKAMSAILINNVECSNLRYVKEEYNNVHNSAAYDPEFNNVWTNRSVGSHEGGSSPTLKIFPHYQDGNGTASFETTNPTVLALTTIGQQQLPATSGLPLEGPMNTFNCENGTAHECNRFYFYIGVSGTVVLKGVESWYEVVDDSMHVTNSTGTALTGISTPKGVNTAAYILGDSNVQMACRESLSEIFGVYKS